VSSFYDVDGRLQALQTATGVVMFGCCARTESGHVAAAPPSSVM